MAGRDPDTLVPWTPATSADAEAVREQLGRILSSASFRNSKRFPVFLRFTVEHGLGSAEPLKERTIGHEVFARDPAYHTAQDPVVRMTATEVRKRLVQYYQRPEHSSEIVIAYQSGSYIPRFLPADDSRPHGLAATARYRIAERVGIVALENVACCDRRRCPASAVLGAWLIAGHQPVGPRMDALSRFLDARSRIVVSAAALHRRCRLFVNQAEEQSTAAVGDMTIQEFLRSDSVRYTDAVTLSLVAGELRARGKQFRIRRPSATALKDLRDGPVVLIGGFNNPWTRKLSEDWRFTLAADPAGAYVRDREHPDDRRWRPETAGRLIKNLRQTYGLITRVKDASTGQLVLTLSGLVRGTRAAGECVVDATCLQAAERIGGSDSENRTCRLSSRRQ